MATPTFQYKSLLSPDSIRILELQPSKASSSDIHCKLIQKTLSQCDSDLFEHYIALSYVWGSQNELQSIYVDGYLFEVTINLRNALQDLREQNRVVMLWADAVCINQRDIEERNRQVSLMGSIYTIARHTVIYLGESNEKIDELLNYVRSTAGSMVNSHALIHRMKDNGTCSPFEAPAMDSIRSTLRELLTCPWFNRVWVFQELVLSRDRWAQCGTHRVKWGLLCNFVSNGQDLTPTPVGWPDEGHRIIKNRSSNGYRL